MTSPVLKFGRYKGSTVDHVDEGYCRWLANPVRATPMPRPGRNMGGQRPLPDDVVAAARMRVEAMDAAKAIKDLGKSMLAGTPHDGPEPVYVFQCDGDMHSRTGNFVFDMTTHASIDDAMKTLVDEYPIEDLGEGEGPRRQTPDPEDDEILLWEVLPSGHRKVVWAFSGWHHSSDDHACGQGSLPGDAEDLYTLAARY